jgi:hypothetical protein
VAHPRLRALRTRLAVLLLAALAPGCRASAPPAATVPNPVVDKADRLGDPRTTFERVALRRFRLGIELPDPSGWHPRKEKSRFALLDHAETGSELAVRSWLEYERVSSQTCEASARLFRDLPRGGDVLLRERRAIAGFDAEVTVAVLPGEAMRGYVTAFGFRGRTCFAFAFRTEARGADRRQTIEARLAMIDERTLNRIASIDGDDDLLREPPAR